MPLFIVEHTCKIVVEAPSALEAQAQHHLVEALRVGGVGKPSVFAVPLRHLSALPPGWAPTSLPFGGDDATIEQTLAAKSVPWCHTCGKPAVVNTLAGQQCVTCFAAPRGRAPGCPTSGR